MFSKLSRNIFDFYFCGLIGGKDFCKDLLLRVPISGSHCSYPQKWGMTMDNFKSDTLFNFLISSVFDVFAFGLADRKGTVRRAA